MQKAQARFEKVSNRSKAFQIRFERSQNEYGRFVTTAYLERGKKNNHKKNRGLLYKAYNLKHRVTGDKPSITKYIDSKEPETIGGKALKNTAKAVNSTVHQTAHTVSGSLLAAETVTVKSADTAKREVVNKARQKYSREAVDDYHKGTLNSLKVGTEAVKGVRQHFKQKKQYKLEKAKYKLKKADYKLFKVERFKPETETIKVNLKNAKTKYKGHKKYYRLSDKTNINRALIIRRKQKYKQDNREIKFDRKKLKKKKKYKVRDSKTQKEIKKYSSPGFLALKPVKYTGKRMKASTWQKAVNEDANNDVMHVVDSAKRRIVAPVAEKFSKPAKLQRKQDKREKLEKKNTKSNQKLKQEDKRLKEKHDKPKRKKKQKNKKKKSSFSDKFKNLARSFGKFIKNAFESFIKKVLFFLLLPIAIFLLIFMFIIMIFSSITSGGGFTLGTYAAQDYDLSQAETYYTKLAYDMNAKVRKIKGDDWKEGLEALGVDTSDYDDEPDEVIWGKSEVFNYTPVYDFDCYKLWSFLCAYHYDFDATDNGDIKYWSYNDDTKAVIKELFKAEYKFEHWYDNTSRWELLDKYVSDGLFHWVSGSGMSGTNGYVDFLTIPTELSKFSNGNRIYFNMTNGEILNYNNSYKATGFYMQDQRYIVTDPSGNQIKPFYEYDTTAFQTEYSKGFGHYYTQNGDKTFWIPKSYYSFTMADGKDFSDTFCVQAAPYDVAIWKYNDENTGYISYLSGMTNTDLVHDEWDRDYYFDICNEWGKTNDNYTGYGFSSFHQKYVWKKDCRLYYNVKQIKTFDDVIFDKLSSMSHSEERLQYYNLLIGTDSGVMYGNHQTLKNIVSGSSIIDYVKSGKIINGLGYDMQEWNKKHCKISDIHEGIDIAYDKKLELYAPFDCEITDVDEDLHSIVLRKDDVMYWYDGSGGTERDTEVYISNANLVDGLSEGDTIKEGQFFATSTGHKNCDELENEIGQDYVHIKVMVDTDGYGWDFIDPRLVLY